MVGTHDEQEASHFVTGSPFTWSGGDRRDNRDYVTFCLDRAIYLFMAPLQGMQDISSLTRDWTYAPCSGRV